MRNRVWIFIVSMCVVTGSAGRSRAIDDGLLCHATKLKRAGQYSFCRLKAEAKGVKKGEAPDYSKCDTLFSEKWGAAETSGAGQCPTEDDETAIRDRVIEDADILAAAIAGNPIPNPAFPASGQTTCWSTAGAVVSCAGTGQDGELQSGTELAYVDHGDGTLTDLNTGLTWELKTDDGTMHDKDKIYTFTEAVSVHIADLNTALLGGFSDWRVPNIKELHSLVNYETFSPAVSLALHNGCVYPCTACSCTVVSFYWSSTTVSGTPTSAWGVDYGDGYVSRTGKGNKFYVRAVRGGD